MSFYLAIVSPLDTPLYELSFPSARAGSSSSSAATPAGGAGSTYPNASSNASSSSFPTWSSFTTGSSVEPSTPTTAGTAATTTTTSTSTTTNSGATGPTGSGANQERHLCQMIAHASLDAVEEVLEGTGSLYLKSVDRHNQWLVSAFIATSVKFILLHDHKNDDGIRLFFLDLWELYVKTSLNPFHTVNTPIRSGAFDGRVRAITKRTL